MGNIDYTSFGKLFLYSREAPLLFTSGLFLFLFLFLIVFCQGIFRRRTAALFCITIFSLYFYYKTSGFYVGLLVATAIVNYYFAQLIRYYSGKRLKAILLTTGLLINFIPLAYFKYTNFFVEILNGIKGLSFKPIDVILPLGISFYTFQMVSYLIDVKRGNLEPAKSLMDFTFYVAFFPKVPAGPITRAGGFLEQIRKPSSVDGDKIARGIYLIIAGLVKKMVIADYLSANFVDRVFDAPLNYSGLENLMATYGYTLQIYCDFSGYTDMAMGIALLLGFTLPINFDSPYKANNVTDFWRRWHISLSTWFRDYLYIPLGGNRHGTARQCINTSITMLLCGLWHGASWNFVFWGFIHGVGLVIHKIFRSITKVRAGRAHLILSSVLTFHFVAFGWIFFKSGTMATAVNVLKQICTSFQPELLIPFVTGYKGVFLAMIAGYALHFLPKRFDEWGARNVERMPVVAQSVLLAGTIWFVLQIKSTSIQPFIYLQF